MSFERSLVFAFTASSLTVHSAQHQRLDGIEFSVRRQVEIFSGILVNLKRGVLFPALISHF